MPRADERGAAGHAAATSRARPRAPAGQRLPQGPLPAGGDVAARDDATDLGQELPTGLLRDVRCGAPGRGAGRRPPGRGPAGALADGRRAARARGATRCGCRAAAALPPRTPLPRRPLRPDDPHLRRAPAQGARQRAERMLSRARAPSRPPRRSRSPAAAAAASGPPPTRPRGPVGAAPAAGAWRADARRLRRPIATYRRHVRRELGAMLGEVAPLRAAIARHDRAGARAAWLAADARYESIGAAYGAFGDLDAAIDGRARRAAGRRALAATSPACTASSSRSGAALDARRRRPRRGSGRATSRTCARRSRAIDDRPARVLAARPRGPRGHAAPPALRAREPVERRARSTALHANVARHPRRARHAARR